MVDDPYSAQVLTGFLFVVVAVALLARAARNDGAAERLLGVAFLLMGTSYAFSEAPYAFELADLIAPFTLLSRITYAVSVIVIAVFTLRILQGEESWARWLVCASALLAFAGIALAVVEEDWAGFNPLRSYGFWLEWVGLLIPFVWMGLAAFAQLVKARERVRLGLCDPLVSSRFLLLSLFGFFQVCGFFIWAALYILFESQRLWTNQMDVLYAATDLLSLAVVWFAFFPPAPYRRWIGSHADAEGR